MSGNENADEKNVCRPLPPRRGGGALDAATAPVQCIAVSFFDFISDFKQKTITELFTYKAAQQQPSILDLNVCD